jgi:ParB family transcriptional regulator, chromosome partitioning protein
MLATIPLDLIENGQRLRDLSEAQVEALMNSIGDVGLLNPITVYRRQLFQGGNAVEGYGLVAGLHRKTACERLGLAEIEANILDLSDLECQIAECDENLCAAQLTPSDRARFTKRRKEAYEALHPETKHGANQHSRGVAEFATPSFAEDQATKTGAAERTVRLDAERGAKIADDALSIIKGTTLDTGRYLDQLKTVPKEEQAKTVRDQLRTMRDGEKAGANVNKIKLDADIRQRAARAVADLIAEYVPADAWDHLKSNLAVTTSKDVLTEFTNITGNSVIDRSAA